MIDKKYGNWTVLQDLGLIKLGQNQIRRNHYLLVQCKCGAIKQIRLYDLRNGKSTQCKPCARTKHGKSRSVEYRTWIDMKKRCYDKKNKRYKDYGGRGITVCDRWLYSFENFYTDIGPRPSNKHSIDRIKNDGNYEPGNCRWATKKEQSNNTRRNKRNNNNIGALNTSKNPLNGFIQSPKLDKVPQTNF
jgi:hypothetical protein